MYSVESLSPPFCYTAAMMCMLFGNDNSARFSIQMVPLIHFAVNSEIMDWAIILSDKIANRILEYRKDKDTGNKTPFYFCAYILDALCFNSEFPMLGWKWTPKDPAPIHIYHKFLWKVHLKKKNMSIEFVTVSSSLFIKPFLIDSLPDFLKKLKLIYP